VQRGKCEFVKKVREAQRLGAKAVVVGGENPDISGTPDTLVNMYSPGMCIDSIFAVEVLTKELYRRLVRHQDSSHLHQVLRLHATLLSHRQLQYHPFRVEDFIIIDHGRVFGLGVVFVRAVVIYFHATSLTRVSSPIITFIVILLLPSALTFITLLIHRIRAARAAQRDRAPEDVVRNLPWRVWTGTGWEKHEGGEDANAIPDTTIAEVDLEEGLPTKADSGRNDEPEHVEVEDASTSLPTIPPINVPWFESQHECAICLSEFAKGDKVRVLPCQHIFHLDEVDEWLIQRKKLVSTLNVAACIPLMFHSKVSRL